MYFFLICAYVILQFCSCFNRAHIKIKICAYRPMYATYINMHGGVGRYPCIKTRVGVNSGIEWELSSIPDSIPGIGLGIGIEKKGIGIELELAKKARN